MKQMIYQLCNLSLYCLLFQEDNICMSTRNMYF